ncbi:hypothetical protein HMSSN036_18620 [Paenibacillus macerans]|nr:hypothetical protein HMSSN036_18620 [Paenibacillus macerans]
MLAFDGVYMDSTLYVNGQQIGEWKYGYSSFEHEITEALAAGENEIVLKVVFQSPNSRWYSGAGIYRNVWLKTRGRSHIVTDGIYVSAARDGDAWQADIETELKLDRDAVLTHTLLYKGEIIQSSAEQVSPRAGHNDSAVILNLQKLTVPDPQLWSTEAPHLYTLVTELRPAAAGAGAPPAARLLKPLPNPSDSGRSALIRTQVSFERETHEVKWRLRTPRSRRFGSGVQQRGLAAEIADFAGDGRECDPDGPQYAGARADGFGG